MRSETLLVNGSALILTRRSAGSTCQSVFARFRSRCEHHTALKWFAAVFTSCHLSPGGRAAFKLFKHLDLWCLSPLPPGIGLSTNSETENTGLLDEDYHTSVTSPAWRSYSF